MKHTSHPVAMPRNILTATAITDLRDDVDSVVVVILVIISLSGHACLFWKHAIKAE